MDAPDTGIRLREMRRRRGLTLRQLSERSGYGVKSISSWETGRVSRMPICALLALTEACGISPAVFFLFDLETDDFSIKVSDLGYRIAFDRPGLFVLEKTVREVA